VREKKKKRLKNDCTGVRKTPNQTVRTSGKKRTWDHRGKMGDLSRSEILLDRIIKRKAIREKTPTIPRACKEKKKNSKKKENRSL